MFDEMEAYLSNTTTPEHRAALVEAAELLVKAGINSHESDIERVLRMADQFTTEDNILDLYTILTNYLDSTIQSFGLTVSDEVPLNCLNHLLSGLLTIANHGDPEIILTLCQREESPEEIITDILDEVTVLSWSNFAPYVDQVSPALIRRIELIVSENLPPEEERKDLTLQRKRLGSLVDRFPDLMVMRVIREGTPLGAEVGVYLELLEEDLVELEAKPDELAREVAGILLASDQPSSELREMGSDLVEDLARDINFVTKTTLPMTKLLGEVIEVNREEA